MSTEDPDKQRAELSALMDGEASAADEACRAWRDGASARADWHAYHLIGDLMRSEEHRADAAGDARLLAAVRERLSAEPVVLAPTPVAAARATPAPAYVRRDRRWMATTAVAAGFVAVAGVLMVTRVSVPDGVTPGLTAGSAAPAADVRPVAVAGPAASQAAVEGAPMIRSAELDRYLAAHRQYANGARQVAPGSAVRNAAATAPGR
jgi:sigma-E factor negative regulatory protein RseA